MFVECQHNDTQLIVPEAAIRFVELGRDRLSIYTTDGDCVSLLGSPAQLWEAYTQIRDAFGRPGYRVDLTWLDELESPAPEGVATGD